MANLAGRDAGRQVRALSRARRWEVCLGRSERRRHLGPFETQGDGICDANFAGRIVTDQGGEIGFEMLGFFRREPGAKIWTLAAAIRFDAADPRYDDFCDRPGFATGEFDMTTYQHRYSIFMPAATLADNVADTSAQTMAVGSC